jgi:catechol-2,3-dioxygenase
MLLLEVGGEPRQGRHPEPGLYHIGFKIGDSPEDVKRAYQELRAKQVPIMGTGDHTVTHSIYLLDPDGNELELYADVSDAWKTDPRVILAPTKPLFLD